MDLLQYRWFSKMGHRILTLHHPNPEISTSFVEICFLQRELLSPIIRMGYMTKHEYYIAIALITVALISSLIKHSSSRPLPQYQEITIEAPAVIDTSYKQYPLHQEYDRAGDLINIYTRLGWLRFQGIAFIYKDPVFLYKSVYV